VTVLKETHSIFASTRHIVKVSRRVLYVL